MSVPCQACNGTGRGVFGGNCATCGGRGVTSETQGALMFALIVLLIIAVALVMVLH